MCIKIVRLKEELEYDSSKPLEDQLKGAKQVVVNYQPHNSQIDQFLHEVERLCKTGVSASLNIKFNHNNHLLGAKAKKEIERLSKDIDFNEVIKLMTLIQRKADDTLEQMYEICLKR